MGVFPGAGANLPTQLWLAARYLQAITWLAAPLFIRRRAQRYGTTALYALAIAVSRGVRQYVLVGAGFDSFALRRTKGVLMDIIVGLVGALVGGFLMSLLGFRAEEYFGAEEAARTTPSVNLSLRGK